MHKTSYGHQGESREESTETLGLIYTQYYIKWITNKDLLRSTGNSTQNPVMVFVGKDLKKKKWIYI